jgi:hypothetical protein
MQRSQHRLGHLVALHQHRCTGLRHNLCASQLGGFLRIVSQRLERLHIDEVTEELLVLVVGNGTFQGTATWDDMPTPLEAPPPLPPDAIVSEARSYVQSLTNQFALQRAPEGTHVALLILARRNSSLDCG